MIEYKKHLLIVIAFLITIVVSTVNLFADTNVILHIITREDIADSELKFMTRRLTSMPSYNVEIVKHNYQAANYPGLSVLPAYLFSGELIYETEQFNILQANQLIKENNTTFKQKTYQANPDAYTPAIYLSNTPQEKQLELFYRPYCPYGIQALKGILESIASNRTSITSLVLTPLAKVKNTDNQENLSKKYYMPKGLPEIEETIRQLVIYKYWPDKLLAYIKERSTDINLPWAKAAQKANINLIDLFKAIDRDGLILLSDGAKRNSKYRVQNSPVYLWNNQRFYNTSTELLQNKELRNLEIPNGSNKCG